MVHRDIITSANGARSFLYGPDPSASHNRASSSITAEPSAPEALTSVRQPRTMTLAFAGINLPPVKDKDAYVRITQETGVRKVIEEIDDDDELNYQVMFEDYFEDTVSGSLMISPTARNRARFVLHQFTYFEILHIQSRLITRTSITIKLPYI